MIAIGFFLFCKEMQFWKLFYRIVYLVEKLNEIYP